MVFQPRRETCLYERLSFLWLWSAGLSLRSIARRSGRSPHTVRRWLRWWERNGRLPKKLGGHQRYLFLTTNNNFHSEIKPVAPSCSYSHMNSNRHQKLSAVPQIP
ncbi:hypothetical protein E2C01_007069 [Portunus trituberculatus]|uniref:Uncharacterized protein n=1 Tax=Portunus trituberculatus TaxID=210409 RepID=A0A5B7CZ23_PORTR|nr:hypothetical protein [Portunus trituberculatus]